ncbi:MAG: PAS domain S-box protein [candidate division Zixibacteria bacterium]|nr:PAS domain S-box protein [candidate division Zixibacteria bacterium]MBU1470880.1 PAS domain S-box protein [candidate division Zixibacteria bacterium]MBU2624258.1 PAS domain S-box protein [candidate division Zixibacteria bacterium]
MLIPESHGAKKSTSNSASDLRRRAEAFLDHLPDSPPSLGPEDIRTLVHELSVHQIELDIQNEELRAAQIALVESRDKFSDLYDFAPVGYLALSEKGLIVQANLTITEMLGIDRTGIINRPFSQFVFDCDQDEYYMLFARLHQTETTQSCELQLKRSNEDVLVALVKGRTVRDRENTCNHVNLCISDITETKLAKEISRVNDELEKRVEKRTNELTISNRELDSFAYSVSHDLRAPLRAIDGFSHTLEMEYAPKLDREGKRLLDIIRRNAKCMGKLIDELLAFSRLGRREVNRSRIDMHKLATEAFEQLNQNNRDRKIHCEIDAIPHAFGDETLIREVFLNLLSNAIKFTKPREVAEIRIEGAASGSEIVYSVCDNGVGFDQKYSGKLFKVFERLHDVSDFEGSGIGLALVERIVQRHGGRIWAESRLGEGAKFSFTLQAANK